MSTRELSLKIRRLSLQNDRVKETALSTLTAVCFATMSNITVLNEFSPLGVCACVIGGKRGVFAFLGALAGYVISFTTGSAVYCGALITATGIRLMLTLKNRRLADRLSPLVCGGSMLLCGMLRIFLYITPYALIALICEALVCFSFAWILLRADNIIFSKTRSVFTETDKVTVCVCVAVTLCGFSETFDFSFNIVRPFILSAVMWTGLYGGISGATASGITAGTIITLMTGSPFFFIPLSVGGMVAAIVKRTGKAAAVTGMLVLSAVSLSLCKVSDQTLIYTLESLFACTLLLVIPDTVLKRMGDMAFPLTGETFTDRRAAVGLYNAGRGLSEAADCISAVSEKLKSVNTGNINWVYESSADSVCARCGLKNTCWNENYSATMDKLSSITPILDRFGRISKDDMPSDFVSDCPKAPEMAAAINRFYGELSLKKATDDYAFQMRGMLAQQFKGLADIIMELSGDIGESGGCDRAASRRVCDVFSNECLQTEECVCITDRKNRMTLEVVCDSATSCAVNDKLVSRIENAVGRHLNKPKIQFMQGGLTKLVFKEKTEYRLETAAFTLAANNETVSGDQKYIFNHGGNGICLISDGMGSGSLAAVESKMTVTLLHRLICAGFSYESALSVVNWALMVKGCEERLATADLLSVDLFTGAARLIKAGAAPSFLKHGDKVTEISFPSMPVGILTKTVTDSRTLKLSEDDVIVMVSDGALYEDNGWIIREISNSKGDLSTLADSLLKRAKARRPSNEDDDITVLCARLVKIG